jgi:hypothetical protein
MMVSSKVEGFLNDLVLDVSKAALKSSQLDDMHDSDTEIYLFLYIFFQRAALRQKREDSIAASRDAITAVLKQVLAPALQSASQVSRASKGGALSTGTASVSYERTGDAPIVQQRALREQLQSIPAPCTPNLSAFAEVVEMCRFIDQQQGHPTVFGAVNLLHFVAVFVTLMPHRRLFELIELIWNTMEIPEARRVQMFYVWSVVDRQNREALRELCAHLTSRPGLTIPMLLEFFPNAEHINTSKFPKSAATSSLQPLKASASSVAAVTTGRAIVHSESDEGVVAPVVVQYGAADNADEVDDDGRTDEDRAFWSNLVS